MFFSFYRLTSSEVSILSGLQFMHSFLNASNAATKVTDLAAMRPATIGEKSARIQRHLLVKPCSANWNLN